MATRSLMALDYANYNTNSILKKHARNRPLGDLEHKHSYIPCQPVLSCRTVDIDLPGTRTYRPKSTYDILEEQQKLIRNLYTKQRAATAIPAPRSVEPAPRSAGAESGRRVNIEVKGRPLTSGPHSSYKSDSQLPVTIQRRPRTTAGRLKNVQPATDSFMIIKVDKDFVETSRHTRELTNRLRSYWNSENNNLSQGKFVRGQKRPDDVPPSLDAWLTFGGAAGDGSEGVIDAFASFKNSEDYYNIEGSVGSRVAQQLQKGDKIRIGINGILQSQDLRVRKWTKPTSVEDKEEGRTEAETTPEKLPDEPAASPRVETEVQTEEGRVEEEKGEEDKQTGEQAEEQLEVGAAEGDPSKEGKDFLQDDFNFNDLMIGDLETMLEDTEPADKMAAPVEEAPPTQKLFPSAKRAAPVRKPRPVPARQPPEEEVDGDTKLKQAIPLSWDDQCEKDGVKVISARASAVEVVRPIMSETHPVRFEKLINGDSRPWLVQPKLDGFRVKQRHIHSPTEFRTRPTSSSNKVKVVYIDPLTQEEEARVQGMSVDEIVNFQVQGQSRQNTAASIHQGFRQSADGILALGDEQEGGEGRGRSRQTSSKASHRPSRPMSTSSVHSDHHQGIPSPKLKTVPIHSSIKPPGDIGITTYSARRTPVQHQDKPSKGPAGRLSPTKPLHKSGAGVGSSIKAGPIQGDTEYIKITSQLKITGASTTGAHHHVGPPGANHNGQPVYNFSPGSNTPRDLDYQEVTYGPEDVLSPNTKEEEEQPLSAKGVAPPRQSPVPAKAPSSKAPSSKAPSSKSAAEEDDAVSVVSESPAPTTVAISIPTADELSDRESPSHSPERPVEDGLTKQQRKAKSMRDEQIDQITDLIGGAIVESSS